MSTMNIAVIFLAATVIMVAGNPEGYGYRKVPAYLVPSYSAPAYMAPVYSPPAYSPLACMAPAPSYKKSYYYIFKFDGLSDH